MLDLETLSTSPRAAIVQIGACFFDRFTGAIGDTFRCSSRPNTKHYDISLSTIEWWMKQDDAARASVFPDTATDINNAVRDFNAFCEYAARRDDFRVWAMPAAFDVVIVEHAFGVEGITTPWRYNAARDVRTILEVADLGKEDRVLPEVAHDALADAVSQAKTVAKAFQKLKGESK